MAHAEKCPLCKGKGKISEMICNGCAGSGWVSVSDTPAPTYLGYGYLRYAGFNSTTVV